MTNTLGDHIKNEYDNEMSILKEDALNELSDDEINTGLENVNDLRNSGMNLKHISGKNVGFISNGKLRQLLKMLKKYSLGKIKSRLQKIDCKRYSTPIFFLFCHQIFPRSLLFYLIIKYTAFFTASILLTFFGYFLKSN